MKSYSALEIFSERELGLLERASRMVAALPEVAGRITMPPTGIIRCHELARAVGRLLDLPHEGGHYGFVEHTWLWTAPLDSRHHPDIFPHIKMPNILDVYAVGKLPQVQLVHARSVTLPHLGWAWRPGEPRGDIDEGMVDALCRLMRDK